MTAFMDPGESMSLSTGTTRDRLCGFTTILKVGNAKAAKGMKVKLYCFDIDQAEERIVFGGEADGKPFMAVHDLRDPNYMLLGYKPQDIANKEAKVKEQKTKLSPENYKELMAKCQKEISEMKTAHLSFPKLEKCIFNVKFYSSSPTYIIGTDFNSSLVLCELSMSGWLKEVTTMQIHSDLIQAMIFVKDSVYTCSADRTIICTKINCKEAVEAAERSRNLNNNRREL